jgi:zinc protease
MTNDRGGLAPARHVLANGAVILTKESRATPAVTISASVAAGAIVDPADAGGAAHFLSRVIDRGTAHRSAEEVGEFLDDRGVTLNVAVTRHQMTATCTCLAEDFDGMLALVGEVLQQPGLPAREIDTRRGEIVTGIRQDEDNPAVMAVEGVLALLYPDGHPYGRRTKGSVESVERIDRERLAACHAAHVGPSSLVLACVGDVEPSKALHEAERVFGAWRTEPSALAAVGAPAPATARRLSVVPMMSKAQADIAYGFVTIPRSDPSHDAFAILNNVLGQYALGGRLGDSIRERQGMAYYVFSAFEPNDGAGPLVVRAGVSPSNVERTIASIDDELRRMAREGVTAKELAASRTFLVTSMPRMLETNGGIASFLQSCEHFGLGLDYDARLASLLGGVTLDQVNDLAARHLVPERATIAVAGPYGEGRL